MKELLKALAGLQAELEPIKKNQENPFFKSKYADLVAVVTYLNPLLKKQGLVFTQAVGGTEGTTLTTAIYHVESGEKIESTMPLFLVKNDPQGQGSAITYARRYALCSLLGVVTEDEDDDGNAASTPVGATQEPKKPYVADKPLVGEATEAQKNLITKLAQERKEFIKTEGMTKQEASDTINRLTAKAIDPLPEPPF